MIKYLEELINGYYEINGDDSEDYACEVFK
jgi:hypothetical protein